MKQIKGVVELHGDNIEVTSHNNVQCVTIEGPSTYDIYSYLTEQDKETKLDLIKELCKDLNNDDLFDLSSWVDSQYS